ncbi:hypothetical protein ACSBR1_017832 [Camellia fascicularis]
MSSGTLSAKSSKRLMPPGGNVLRRPAGSSISARGESAVYGRFPFGSSLISKELETVFRLRCSETNCAPRSSKRRTIKLKICDVEDVIDDFATEAMRTKLRKKEKSIVKEWVCVSNVFNLKVLVEAILKSANVECGNLEIDELQKRLQRCLDGNRYILVLDDVWNENREKWIELEDFLTSGEKGSKIVVTTRSEIVARVMGTTSPYPLKGLLEDDSWSLFKQLAFRRRQLEENPSLVAIGKKILTNSGGVPLAIRTIGSLLYLKDTEIEWLIVKDKLWEIAQHETHILPTLKVMICCSDPFFKMYMKMKMGTEYILVNTNVENMSERTYHVAFDSTSCSSSSENVPSSVGKLKHLRYLDLSRNFHLATLPKSICKPQDLQTLKLSNCYELRLENARNGTSRLKELKGANLKAKKFIRKLTLEWTGEDDGVDYADADGKVLEDL